jgi:hypothetical protein
MTINGHLKKIHRSINALRDSADHGEVRRIADDLTDAAADLREDLLGLAPQSLSTANIMQDRTNFLLRELLDKVASLEKELERLSAMHPKNSHPPHPAWHDRFRA